MNDFFNLFYSFFNNNLWKNSLNNLRNFNDLLNNTRNNNYLLNNFLHLNYFWHFNHFLNNLLHWNFNLFNPIHMSQHLNYFFLDVFDGFRNLNVMINNFFYLNNLRLSHYYRISYLNNNRNLPFDHLNNRLFNNLLNPYKSLMNNWNLHNSFHLFWNLSHSFNYLCYYLLNLFNTINRN